VASNPVVCTALNACHSAGTCDPATGTCSNPAKPSGTSCSDGNACNADETCDGTGSCQAGSNPVVCTAAACHSAGTCDPATGACSNAVPLQDGTACDDGNVCTNTESCQAGACTPLPGDDSSCTEALNEAVIPTEVDPTTGAAAGATPAAFSVTQDGAASYVMKLWEPPGRGVQPNLSLVYGSRFGTSILGVGWQLTPLSQITRCTRTTAQDLNSGPVDFGPTPALCMDGRRLVSFGTNEYRPENDPFTRVVPDSNLTGFTVYLRDGRVLTYGRGTGKLTLSDSPATPGCMVGLDSL